MGIDWEELTGLDGEDLADLDIANDLFISEEYDEEYYDDDNYYYNETGSSGTPKRAAPCDNNDSEFGSDELPY